MNDVGDIVDRLHDLSQRLVAEALAELSGKLRSAGAELQASGLSLFLVTAHAGTPDCVQQAIAVEGDVDAIFMFAPDWPFALSGDLMDLDPDEPGSVA